MIYITFEEVKDILKCSIDETKNMNEAIERTLQHIYLKGLNDAGQSLMGHIEELEETIRALQQESKWIPVSEELPKKSGDYWCTFGGTNLTGSDYYTTELDAKEIFDESEEYAGWRSQNVIAWMPLPKPFDPQTESEDKR